MKKKSLQLIGGISGLIIGAWIIFITKSNLGFIPAIMGVLLLILKK